MKILFVYIVLSLICLAALCSCDDASARQAKSAATRGTPDKQFGLIKAITIVGKNEVGQDSVFYYPNSTKYYKGDMIQYHNRYWQIKSVIN